VRDRDVARRPSVFLSKPRDAEKSLDKESCQWFHTPVLDVEIIDDPSAAAVALVPIRSQILLQLSEPASAATLAVRLGIPRQKVNYHLRALETHGLVRVAGTRRWGGLTERLLVATAASYVISPDALSPVTADLARGGDRLSARYLIALAARAVREVGGLLQRSEDADRRLATLSIDTAIRFRSAADRAAFSRELAETVTSLVSRYHDASAPGGRDHRLVLVAHPLPQEPDTKEPS
jgi:DNA-binding transcriptional ArsR family regulator